MTESIKLLYVILNNRQLKIFQLFVKSDKLSSIDMGSISSKAHSVPCTPNKTLGTPQLTRSKGMSDLPQLDTVDQLLDPRSPNIDRTPLSAILASDRRPKQLMDTALHTPNNIMRRRLLRDLGYKYTEKELVLLDPRSPTMFIPRTPIILAETNNTDIMNNSMDFVDAANSSNLSNSFEFTECIEDLSVRQFCEKITNITLDDSDGEAFDTEPLTIRREYLETNFDLIELIEEINEGNDDDDEEEKEERKSSKPILHDAPIELHDSQKDELPINAEPQLNTSILSVIEPVFSSTPTTVTTIETPVKKTTATEAKLPNRIYEDIENDEEGVVNGKCIPDNHIAMTPVQKFQKKDGERVRTPLSVINRRTKSAENIPVKQSRIRGIDENNKFATLTSDNFIAKENQNQVTPKTSLIPVRVPLSNKNTMTKIPLIKRREF